MRKNSFIGNLGIMMKLNKILIGLGLLFVFAGINSLAAADGALPEDPGEACGGAGDTSAVEQLRVEMEQLAVARRQSTTTSAQDAAKVAVIIMNRRLIAREPKKPCGCCSTDSSAVFGRCPACLEPFELSASAEKPIDVDESSEDINALFLTAMPEFMYKAILNGKQAEVVALLKHPSAPENFVNQCLPGGRTPLTLAISSQNEEMVKFLLDRGADVTRTDQYATDEFPLETAIMSGNTKIVAILLNHARTPKDFVNQHIPESSMFNGMTPLTYACLLEDQAMIQCLLDCGAGVDVVDKSGRLPSKQMNKFFLRDIYNAIKNNQPAEVVRLLNSPKAPENCINECLPDGQTPLTLAISLNNEEMVKLLLDGGADVTRVDQRGTETFQLSYFKVQYVTPDEPGKLPLEAAIGSGNEKIIAILLDHERTPKDFVNQPFCDRSNLARGMTPLTYACNCLYVHPGVIRCLLGHAAAVDLVDRHNRSPLGHAIRNTKECVAALLDHPDTPKDFVNKPLPEGFMPLAYARECRHIGVTQYLLGRDDVDKGIFPASVLAGYRLDAAISRGDKEAVAAALSLVEDPDERQKLISERSSLGPCDSSPLEHAINYNRIEIMSLLLDSCAAIANDAKCSPLFFAIAMNRPAAVEALLDHPRTPKDLVNQPFADGSLPLAKAFYDRQDMDMAVLLLRRGAGITSTGELDLVMFAEAIAKNKQMLVALFLEHPKAPKDLIHQRFADFWGDERTPLEHAVYAHCSAMVEFLQSRGASIITPDGELDHALFALAIECSNLELVKAFLDYPLAVSTDFVHQSLKIGSKEYTPLEYARHLDKVHPMRHKIIEFLERYEKK